MSLWNKIENQSKAINRTRELRFGIFVFMFSFVSFMTGEPLLFAVFAVFDSPLQVELYIRTCSRLTDSQNRLAAEDSTLVSVSDPLQLFPALAHSPGCHDCRQICQNHTVRATQHFLLCF